MGLLTNFSSVKFDKNKLLYTTTQVEIFDNQDNKIKSNAKMNRNTDAQDIPQHVIDAFVSIEDKSFYTHHGINYKRIIKATINNLKNFKIKEGASTISQQLIKNTHLTSEKTLKRKIDEIILAKELEKNLTKDEIMSSYLNAIYFGNGAFGINNASQKYFSKEAKDLSLEEGAMLAGIIKSPSLYSPLVNKDLALKRRNLVLKEMFNDGHIDKVDFDLAVKKPINLHVNENYFSDNDYASAAVVEACKILGLQEKDFLIKGYKIYTYFDEKTQITSQDAVDSVPKEYDEIDRCAIVIDNITGGVKAYACKSNFNLLTQYRQPGSVFKPIISYAPAIESAKLSSCTYILDEKTNFDGYSPKNYKDTYHGMISTKDALANSYNVPSVKILNQIGIENGKRFANNMCISFDKKDNGLSLALGGLTKGVKILDMANCYQALANGGNLVKSSFIKEIRTHDNKILYKNECIAKRCMKDSTAFILTDMLRESVKSGTARKLNLGFDIASKTGTIGDKNGNSDAWNISYTPDNTLCVWCGSESKKLLPCSITGSNLPTDIAQIIYKKMPCKSHFEVPESVEEVAISEIDYIEKKQIVLAPDDMPDRYKRKVYFALDNLPKEVSTILTTPCSPHLNCEASINQAKLSFEAKGYLTCKLYRQCDDEVILLAKYDNKSGIVEYIDKDLLQDEVYSYYIESQINEDITKDIEHKTKVKSNVARVYLAKKEKQNADNIWA